MPEIKPLTGLKAVHYVVWKNHDGTVDVYAHTGELVAHMVETAGIWQYSRTNGKLGIKYDNFSDAIDSVMKADYQYSLHALRRKLIRHLEAKDKETEKSST